MNARLGEIVFWMVVSSAIFSGGLYLGAVTGTVYGWTP